jgi:ABC-2 type transport system ATP-binding protein
MSFIKLRALTKRFGRRLALNEIDLSLESGQLVGIVGPDGAGKTTLLRALAGLLEVEAEEASVLGHDLRGDVTSLKTEIGYVPQTFSLHRDLSVAENLRFTARLHRLGAMDFAARCDDLLARTGLTPFADRPAGALSGGMKQKLAVANALLLEPRLLLLDEPTAGVDVLARAEIWSMLEAASRRALILVSTGYLDEAAACHRLVYLDGGRLVANGSPDELRASVPVDLYRLWGDDPQRIASAAQALAYVAAARASGRWARVEVRRAHAPPAEEVLRDLRALPGCRVHLAERLPLDMEATLLALARGRIQGFEGSRIQGDPTRTLEPSNPGALDS